MRKLLLLLTFFVSASVLLSCGDDEKSPVEDGKSAVTPIEYGFPSFADKYFIPSSVRMKSYTACDSVQMKCTRSNGQVDIYDNTTTFSIPYDCYIIMDCEYEDHSYMFNSKNENDLIAFEKYAKAYGDTVNYNGMHCGPYQYFFSVMPVVALDVKTDRQFDANHPAGSSIGDIINLYIWKDILSMNSAVLENKEGDLGLFEQYRCLNSISTDNPVYLLPDWFRLHFKTLPDTRGVYNLTISMKFGADPITGETVEIEPVTVAFEFLE
jgi:hypothetical protein